MTHFFHELHGGISAPTRTLCSQSTWTSPRPSRAPKQLLLAKKRDRQRRLISRCLSETPPGQNLSWMSEAGRRRSRGPYWPASYKKDAKGRSRVCFRSQQESSSPRTPAHLSATVCSSTARCLQPPCCTRTLPCGSILKAGSLGDFPRCHHTVGFFHTPFDHVYSVARPDNSA